MFNTTYIQCTTGCPLPTANNPTINYNHMPGAFYLDLGGSYEINDKWQTYFKIDNVANVDPVPSPPVALPEIATGPIPPSTTLSGVCSMSASVSHD